MKLINTSSSTKRICFVSFLLLCFIDQAQASTTNSIVASGLRPNPSTPNATTNARFNPTSLPAAADGIQYVRRAKEEGAKKYGDLMYTEISKCTENSTPLDNGGTKVTKKCARQVFANNDINTVNGSGRTTAAVTWSPSATPSTLPTSVPTSAPTSEPTFVPTSGPTAGPTLAPTLAPTWGPTASPTGGPTTGPTSAPTNTETLVSALPDEARATNTSSSKTVIGALIGGVLGFVVLAAGAKAVETALSRRAASNDSSAGEDLA